MEFVWGWKLSTPLRIYDTRYLLDTSTIPGIKVRHYKIPGIRYYFKYPAPFSYRKTWVLDARGSRSVPTGRGCGGWMWRLSVVCRTIICFCFIPQYCGRVVRSVRGGCPACVARESAFSIFSPRRDEFLKFSIQVLLMFIHLWWSLCEDENYAPPYVYTIPSIYLIPVRYQVLRVCALYDTRYFKYPAPFSYRKTWVFDARASRSVPPAVDVAVGCGGCLSCVVRYQVLKHEYVHYMIPDTILSTPLHFHIGKPEFSTLAPYHPPWMWRLDVAVVCRVSHEN